MSAQKYIKEWRQNSRKIQPDYNGEMTIEEGYFVIQGSIGGEKFKRRISWPRLVLLVKEQREIIEQRKRK